MSSELVKRLVAIEKAVREIGSRHHSDDDGPAWTIKQAAARIGMSTGFLYRTLPSGKKRWEVIGGFKPEGSGNIRIPREAVRRFNEGREGGAS